MKYVSIDIETAGLDKTKCQILEIAAIYDDLSFDNHSDNYFHCYISPRNGQFYTGEPRALEMNNELIENILLKKTETPIYTEQEVPGKFKKWLVSLGYTRYGFTPAGKNVGTFDLPFIEELPNYASYWIIRKHRTLDVGNLYVRPTDDVIPDLNECLRRAKINLETRHNGLDDALLNIKLIRQWALSWKINRQSLNKLDT